MFSNENGSDEIGNHMPGCVRCLRIVGRGFTRGDFTPSAYSIRDGLHQKNAAVLHNAKTRFKRRLQSHVNFAECYGFNLHKPSERLLPCPVPNSNPTAARQRARRLAVEVWNMAPGDGCRSQRGLQTHSIDAANALPCASEVGFEAQELPGEEEPNERKACQREGNIVQLDPDPAAGSAPTADGVKHDENRADGADDAQKAEDD